MAKITFDVTDLEPDEGGSFYAGPDPKRGAYRARVANAEMVKTKDGTKDMLKYRVEIVAGEFKGWAGFDNITMEPSTKFKLNQLISGAKYKARKGTIDALVKWLNENHPSVGLFVQMGTDLNGNARAEVGRVFPIENINDGGGDDSNTSGEDDTEEEIEDAESEEEDESEEDEDSEEEDDEGYTEDELNELSDDDLAEVADEYDVSYKRSSKTDKILKKDDVVAAILEAQGSEEEDESEDEEEDEEAEEADETPTSESLNLLSLGDLKAQATERGVYRKGMKKPAMVKAILDSYDGDDSKPPF